MACLWMVTIMPEFSQQKQPHPMRSDTCNCNRKPTEPSMFGYRHIDLLNSNFRFCKQTLTADTNNWPERYTVYVFTYIFLYIYAKILKDNAMLKHVQKGSTSTSSVDRLILEMFWSTVLLQHDLINHSCSPFFCPPICSVLDGPGMSTVQTRSVEAWEKHLSKMTGRLRWRWMIDIDCHRTEG